MTDDPADAEVAAMLGQFRSAMLAESAAVTRAAEMQHLDLAKLIFAMQHCQGRIVMTGMGKAGCVARKAASTFSSTGTPSLFLHPSEAAHGDLGIVAAGDLLLAISNQGETAEVLDLLPFMKRGKIPVAVITAHPDSSLARHAEWIIDSGVDREADPDSIAPTCSTTVAMAICDALAITLMQQRGFSREQFAIFHPGGYLGRKLLSSTGDLMTGSGTPPVVSGDIPLADAIGAITSGGKGAVFVTAADGGLAGVLTDGDVRRIFSSTAGTANSNPLVEKVSSFMSRDPKTINSESLAADALNLMEQHEISVLPVVDESRKIIGVIHLHDLIRAGLA